ncbi:hypothetical protein PDN66_25260 [Bacillus cereus]|uniref:hypothetical protein n=1 Tax=Bacillus cereus TaxID=1396 RepID=UPI003D65A20D|nr:hypothetical protein [Bacillus cereus]
MKRYRVEFTETKSYEAYVEASDADKAIDKVRNGLVEEEELIEKDVIIDGMYLQKRQLAKANCSSPRGNKEKD